MPEKFTNEQIHEAYRELQEVGGVGDTLSQQVKYLVYALCSELNLSMEEWLATQFPISEQGSESNESA